MENRTDFLLMKIKKNPERFSQTPESSSDVRQTSVSLCVQGVAQVAVILTA